MKKGINLCGKISKTRHCWNLLKYTTSQGAIGLWIFGNLLLRKGMLTAEGAAGIVTVMTKPLIDGILEATKDETKRIASEKYQQLFPSLSNEDKDNGEK